LSRANDADVSLAGSGNEYGELVDDHDEEDARIDNVIYDIKDLGVSQGQLDRDVSVLLSLLGLEENASVPSSTNTEATPDTPSSDSLPVSRTQSEFMSATFKHTRPTDSGGIQRRARHTKSREEENKEDVLAAQEIDNIREVEVEDSRQLAAGHVHFARAAPQVHVVEALAPAAPGSQNVGHLDHSDHRFSRLASKDSPPPFAQSTSLFTRLLSAGPFTRTG